MNWKLLQTNIRYVFTRDGQSYTEAVFEQQILANTDWYFQSFLPEKVLSGLS